MARTNSAYDDKHGRNGGSMATRSNGVKARDDTPSALLQAEDSAYAISKGGRGESKRGGDDRPRLRTRRNTTMT
eukprot:147034-Prorocentrum_minimum.AAC.5